MAVCGRCWLCGTKFDCTLTDVGAAVVYIGENLPTPGSLNDEGRKLCTSCVHAIDGDLINDPNEPHGDGVPPVDRIGQIIGVLVHVAEARRRR